jgi:hypothetical protein
MGMAGKGKLQNTVFSVQGFSFFRVQVKNKVNPGQIFFTRIKNIKIVPL